MFRANIIFSVVPGTEMKRPQMRKNITTASIRKPKDISRKDLFPQSTHQSKTDTSDKQASII
jgi:hypothetical protein